MTPSFLPPLARRALPGVLLLATLGVTGCKADPLPRRRIPVPSSPTALQRGEDTPPQRTAPSPMNTTPRKAAQQAGHGAVAGLRWKLPPRWKLGPRRPMRVATYIIPSPSPNQVANGECSLFYFGQRQGGSIAANLNRWKQQFRPEAGKSNLTLTKRDTQTIRGLKVATLELRGTFLFSPRPMSPTKIPRPNHHMLSAIVRAPKGLVFFKCVGPHSVMRPARREFNALLQSFKTQ